MEYMTAKVSCFARAYHYQNNTTWIFKDEYAADLLGENEYAAISSNMAEGIKFFAPGFEGDKEQTLEWIVNNQLAPSVLARSAFNETHLWSEYGTGMKQYVLFAAGYDTFSHRNTFGDISIFELDLPGMIEDRLTREAESGLHSPANCHMIPCDLADEGWKGLLAENGFLPEQKSYGSLLGISYYLSKEAFEKMLGNISEVFTAGSAICFDYPASEGSQETVRNEKLAKAAKEEMKAKYSYPEQALLVYHNYLKRGMSEEEAVEISGLKLQ